MSASIRQRVRTHAHVLPDGHGRKETALLGHLHDAELQDLARTQARERIAAKRTLAEARPDQSAHQAKDRRLAGAVRSDDARDAALLDATGRAREGRRRHHTRRCMPSSSRSALIYDPRYASSTAGLSRTRRACPVRAPHLDAARRSAGTAPSRTACCVRRAGTMTPCGLRSRMCSPMRSTSAGLTPPAGSSSRTSCGLDHHHRGQLEQFALSVRQRAAEQSGHVADVHRREHVHRAGLLVVPLPAREEPRNPSSGARARACSRAPSTAERCVPAGTCGRSRGRRSRFGSETRDRSTVETHVAGVFGDEAGDEIEHGRLARAVGSDESGDAAELQRQASSRRPR